jgi:hypothetical protein
VTSGVRFGSRRISATTALVALGGLALAAALLTPEGGTQGGGYSSYSAGPEGTRILYELAQRMGWRASRRETLLDSAHSPDVQVVIGSGLALGARETHRLLDNVRRGGGLIFTVTGSDDLADSLGLRLRDVPRNLVVADGSECRDRVSLGDRPAIALPPSGYEIAWRRPAPGPVTDLATGFAPRASANAPIAVGFPLGAGRVAAISSAGLLTNDALRVCTWAADIVAARALEYVRGTTTTPRIAFDEFHHGYGVHGGSMKAVSMFLSHTTSGRFLAQALVAGLILLLAAAPRPIVPRDAPRIARRSPLEHADALAHAYVDVAATRTATARLVEGLRRRAGRTVSAGRHADDLGFLDAIERRSPAVAPHVATVRRAMGASLPVRDFTTVGHAISAIERELLTVPPARS